MSLKFDLFSKLFSLRLLIPALLTAGEGARPLLDRPELRGAVNRRFDDVPPVVSSQNEPRVVAIIPERGQASSSSECSGMTDEALGLQLVSPVPVATAEVH